MKNICISFVCATIAFAFVACDARVNTAPPVVEKKETTIVNPPAEKKVENNTTIVNPPAEEETLGVNLSSTPVMLTLPAFIVAAACLYFGVQFAIENE